MDQMIDELVAAKGIQTRFIDAWGKPAQVQDASKAKLLKAMGYAVDNAALLEEQLDDEIDAHWSQMLNPVQVCRSNETLAFNLRVPIEQANDTFALSLLLEEGDKLSLSITPSDHVLVNVIELDDIEVQEYRVVIEQTLPLGYHLIEVKEAEHTLASSRLIVAPSACYIPEAIQKGRKIWGLSVQLYCVRSQRNWGIGDFTDLTFLLQKAAAQGADFIGLNPIHELYPANPEACSPYSPSSRRWLNYLYLDVEIIAGFDSEVVQQWFANERVAEQLEALRKVDYVDYKSVATLKLGALKKVFAEYRKQFLSKNTKQNKTFKAFVKEGADSLHNLAVFEALQDTLHADGEESWGWPVFPEEYRDADAPAVIAFAKKHKDLVLFYQFLQWQAQLQFEAASKAASDAGMLIGLYRDLAVGVSEGSAEIWSNKDLYCTEASIGAPPDILGPLGQNWGLPPMDPVKLFEQGYQPIIDLFASNMKASGALRIDHVMALLRLWWVCRGDDASQGGYVGYPVDDLLAILALESVRNQSLVIGEDLGTVPEEIRSKLLDNGMYSYRVFFFEQAEDGGFYAPDHYPEQSMSTLTIHDLPTLIGYWHCDDLALGKEVGLYPDSEVLASLYDTRHENKQHILNTLHGHGSISKNISTDVNQVGMSQELNYGMQTHMATGSSALLSLQLEDWLQMDKPVNVPGTFNEYPNWKRKLSRNLEDIFDDRDIVSLSQQLTQRRRAASKDE